MRPDSSGSLTCQGWGRLPGDQRGESPLARSYRGPDNVTGPITGHLNPALAVVQGAELQAQPRGVDGGESGGGGEIWEIRHS